MSICVASQPMKPSLARSLATSPALGAALVSSVCPRHMSAAAREHHEQIIAQINALEIAANQVERFGARRR